MQKTHGFTKKEEELLEACKEFLSVKKAAEGLGISYGAAKQRLYRIRRRFERATWFLKELDEIGFLEILAKMPACQTCKLLNDDGWCKYSDVKIDVKAFDVPCALWQPGELKGSEAILEGIDTEEK